MFQSLFNSVRDLNTKWTEHHDYRAKDRLWKMLIKHIALQKSLRSFDIRRVAGLMRSASSKVDAFALEI